LEGLKVKGRVNPSHIFWKGGHVMSKSILQRIPDSLLVQVDKWAEAHGEINRTVAVNLLIGNGLELDRIKLLQNEVEGLKSTIVRLNKPYVHAPLIEALQKAAEDLAMAKI
jgi:hypothetical protein